MDNKKVFGYPSFNEDGEKVLVTYEGPYRDMLMDIRVYHIKKGEKKVFLQNKEETAVLLLKGKLTLAWEGNTQTISRDDLFTEGPWCLHVCKDTEIIVEGVENDTEFLVQRTYNDKTFSSRLYKTDDTPLVDVCRGKYGDTANRRVNTIFDYETAPYSNMVLGEVFNDPGNWSAYIPHHHPQPETYYFRFDRPEGFGASFVGDEVYKITDGSFSAIPGGKTHPQSCAPGFVLYTCWMIRHLPGEPWTTRIDDERYTWLLK